MAARETIGDNRYAPTSCSHPHQCPCCGDVRRHDDFKCNEKYQSLFRVCQDWTGETE